MSDQSNPPINTTLKYYETPSPLGTPPTNLEQTVNNNNYPNHNYYPTSDWGVRLLPISSKIPPTDPTTLPTDPTISSIRIVWSDFGATETKNFTITVEKYLVVDNPQNEKKLNVFTGTVNDNTKINF